MYIKSKLTATSYSRNHDVISTLCNYCVHPPLAFSADETEMRVTWVTRDSTDNPEVGYGQTNLAEYSAQATKSIFTDGGSAKRSIYVYRATMISLKPGKGYGRITRFIVWMLLMIYVSVNIFKRLYWKENACILIKSHWSLSLRFQSGKRQDWFVNGLAPSRRQNIAFGPFY